MLLADWIEIELAASASDVSSISIDEFADDLREDVSDPGSADEPEPDDENGRDPSPGEDARERAEDAFMELRQRAQWLQSRYPISIRDGGEVADWDFSSHSSLLYRFLVLLRARQFYGQIMGGGAPEPGFLFEEIVTLATKSYVGGGSGVRFGDAGGQRGNGLSLVLSEAIEDLAQRMNERPSFSVSNEVGDYRADAVAWKPFGDGRPGQLVMCTQATISEEEWLNKQIPPRWHDRRLIQLIAPPLSGVAFVETMSSYSPDFWKAGPLKGVPFDRLRIISLVSDADLEPELAQGIREWTLWAAAKLPRG